MSDDVQKRRISVGFLRVRQSDIPLHTLDWDSVPHG